MVPLFIMNKSVLTTELFLNIVNNSCHKSYVLGFKNIYMVKIMKLIHCPVDN